MHSWYLTDNDIGDVRTILINQIHSTTCYYPCSLWSFPQFFGTPTRTDFDSNFHFSHKLRKSWGIELICKQQNKTHEMIIEIVWDSHCSNPFMNKRLTKHCFSLSILKLCICKFTLKWKWFLTTMPQKVSLVTALFLFISQFQKIKSVVSSAVC